MKGRILVVEDDVSMCEILESDLGRRGFDLTWFTTSEKAQEAARQEEFDVVLADLNLPGMNGIDLCRHLVSLRPDVPVIVMTAFGSLESAIAAIRAGAYDFVTKPVDLALLSLSLERAVQHRRLKEQVRTLSQAVTRLPGAEELIGESPPMRDLAARLVRIAETHASVLISGESGTGKELVARVLHRRSGSGGPFIPLNCAAMPETLLESELFGHKRGAFTDAREDRKGLFLEADGGTLFLDEIGEVPLVLQPKLLRALEERRVRPLGGNQEIGFDVRIISATNRDLETAVEEGRFREDLFYRLNVIGVEVPPLRARGTDILLLARHFIGETRARGDKSVVGLSESAAERLLTYSWPGNVRELRNAIDHAVALTRHDHLLIEDLPEKVRKHVETSLAFSGDNPAELVTLEEMERRYIHHVLKAVGGNRSAAARILGLDRKTIYRRLGSS